MSEAAPPAGRPHRLPPGPILRAGWSAAVGRAAVAFVAVLILAQVLSALNALGRDRLLASLGPREPALEEIGLDVPDDPIDALRTGGLTFLSFHNAGVRFRMALPDVGGADLPLGLLQIDVGMSFTLMLGAALAVWLLWLGGRAVARRATGPWWAGALHGAKVAPPYAVGALVVALLSRQELGVPGGDGPVVGALAWSPVPSALGWTLLLALAAGVAGGLAADRDASFPGRTGRWIRAVLAGGWRMTWVTVMLAFVGLLIVAGTKPRDVRAYFDIAGRLGPELGSSFVLTTALATPNMGTWVASGAMGAPAVETEVGATSCALLAYWRFPRGTTAAPSPPPSGPAPSCRSFLAGADFSPAPPGYFLFLLVPLAASVSGGRLAAGRSPRRTRREGAAAGAAAGGVFALLFLVLILLSRMSVDASGGIVALFLGGGITVGPSPVLGFALALLWGSGLGAVAGATAAPAEPPPALESEGETTRDPGDPGPSST
jgi:hypothetical protein